MSKEEPKKTSISEINLKPLTHKEIPMEIIYKWTKIHARDPPCRRSSHTSFLYKEKYLYIIGGVDITERKQNDIYKIDLSSNNPQWEKIILKEGKLEKIAYHAGILYNGIYYIIGGQNDKMRSLNTIQKFNVEEEKISNKIEPDKKIFPSIESHTCNLYKNQIIIYGGNKGKFFNKHVYSFNLQNEEIKNLTENLEENRDITKMPLPRADHSSEIIGDKLFVYGGYGRKTPKFHGFFNDLWCFNLTNNTWNQIKFGDENLENEEEEEEDESEEEENENKEENDNEEKKEEKKENKNKKNQKEKKNKINKPEARSGQTMINVNGQLYIFGGKLGVIKECNELWILNPNIPKFEIIHGTIIEKFTYKEIENQTYHYEKQKKKFHWLSKREYDDKTNPLPFALKKNKYLKKSKSNKEEKKKKLNNSFTDIINKHSNQVLSRPNVTWIKHGLIYNVNYEKLKIAVDELTNNEIANLENDYIYIEGCIPEPRDGQSCNLYQKNKLIIFGGDRNKFPFNDLFIFEIDKNVNSEKYHQLSQNMINENDKIDLI